MVGSFIDRSLTSLCLQIHSPNGSNVQGSARWKPGAPSWSLMCVTEVQTVGSSAATFLEH